MPTKLTQLTAFSLFAGFASSASAAIIKFENVDIPIPTTFIGVSLDLETGNSNTTSTAGQLGGDVNFVFGGEWITNDADGTEVTPSWQPVRVGTGTPTPVNNDLVRNLGLGEIVGPSSVFASGYGGSTGHIAAPPSPAAPNETFEAGERGFIGFALELPDTTIAYGWMEVTLQENDVDGVIHSWAFEDNGSPLAVGSVIPEPSHTLLIGLGLMASVLRRRR
ncbi:PEP-CTERM sorting domain-containing protein [Akkermansiaceae bacterium]|nr:PEP-CTERM sorting domain-containing protein [Akkermansiaceae bacterium]MDA7888479.1 PEP-CTERM sorting domain-containing protein [Akkermansiaceae bacterium]